MTPKRESKARSSLRVGMSVAAFDAGYFYAAELRAFARDIGVTVGNFRKMELEELIRTYLITGSAPQRKPIIPRKNGEDRDKLAPDVPVVNYIGDRRTKTFLLDLVRTIDARVFDRSGQWYWLNDWRRQQQAAGQRFTYLSLATKLLELMRSEGRLPQIPSARMNNFISDLRADPANEGLSRKEVLKAWERLKDHLGPKTYQEYKKLSKTSK